MGVQFSSSVVSDSLWPHGLQHTRLPCPLSIPGLMYTHTHTHPHTPQYTWWEDEWGCFESMSLYINLRIFANLKIFNLLIIGHEMDHYICLYFSAQVSYSVMSDSLQPHGLHHTRLPCPSPNPGVYSNSYPSRQWCYPTISSFDIPFSSHIQSFLASGSFPMSQFFTSGCQTTGASASASVLPMNIQDWSPLGLTGLISLQSKGLSRVFSNTTVQKHQFFSAQFSL